MAARRGGNGVASTTTEKTGIIFCQFVTTSCVRDYVMKICFVAEFYPPHIGGGEIFIQKLVEGLAQGGHECIVITSRTEKKLPAIEEKNNLKVVRIRIPSILSRFWFSLFATYKIILFARHCDIIHGASYGGAIPSFLGAKLLRKKSILMVYEFMGGLWKNLESNWFLAQFYQTTERIFAHLSFDKFIAISRYTRNCLRFLGVPDHKLDIVYGGENTELLKTGKNPLELRKEIGFTPEDFIYLVYGRAGISKGIEFFVEAIPLITKRIPTAKFILILTKSGNKTWNSIMDKLRKLPSPMYRIIPGMPREELSDFLCLADCIVIPSLSEGFGFAALEACTLKKRVVATDVGSLPEVIFGEYVLVKPGSPQALAEGCCRSFFGNMDYGPPKAFRWEETVSRCRKIYDEILNR